MEALENNTKVLNTVELLNKSYNGTTTLKSMESINIRKKLLDELIKFQGWLYEYECEELDEEDKERILRKIKSSLSAASEFTAFKRWMIKEVDELREEFKEYI